MTEPTDHLAEAELYLDSLDDFIKQAAQDGRASDPLIVALACVGHALLALSEPKAPIAVLNVSGNPSKAELEALRAAIRQPPPLSPSEG